MLQNRDWQSGEKPARQEGKLTGRETPIGACDRRPQVWSAKKLLRAAIFLDVAKTTDYQSGEKPTRQEGKLTDKEIPIGACGCAPLA